MTSKKIISANNIQIQTLTSGTSDKTILFVHGNSSSADSWKSQLEDDMLTGKYKLVAYDLPGCGLSTWSGQYDLTSLSANLRTIAYELNLTEYILVGISLGTCIIGEAAPDLPGCKGLVLVSANLTNNEHHPGTYLKPSPELMASVSPSVDDDLLEGFIRQLGIDPRSSFAKEYRASFKCTDPNFRIAIGAAIGTGAWTDEFANVAGMRVPVCIIFGKDEQVIQTNYLDDFPGKWRDKVNYIDGASHFVNINQPTVFNELLLEFAADVFK